MMIGMKSEQFLSDQFAVLVFHSAIISSVLHIHAHVVTYTS